MVGTNFNIALPFSHTANRHPDSLAISSDGEEMTYRQLLAIVRRIAHWLAGDSQSLPRRVGILGTRSWEACAAILGTAWAGATYMPLNLSQPQSALAELFCRTKLDAIIADRSGAQKLTREVLEHAPKKVLCVRGDDVPPTEADCVQSLEKVAKECNFEPKCVGPDDLAYIEFTSGSAGVPKGVMIPNRGVDHLLRIMQRRYQITSDDRIAGTSDTSFDISVFDMFMTWFTGASLHVAPKTQAMAPAKFIQEHKITVWFSVPSVATAMNRMGMLKEGAFPSLRVSLFSGEPLPVKAALAWKRAASNSLVDNLYGPTEATVICLYERLGEEFNITQQRDIVAIGRPLEGARAAVWDANHNSVPAHTAGELAICGPQLALGYLDDSEKTAARFIKKDGTTWYLTGDLAYEDDSGVFHYLGRMENQVRVLGHSVELEEVETYLRYVYQTDSVAAVTWPSEFGVATGIVAFVTASKARAHDPEAALRKRMPAYMIPQTIYILDDLPVNTSGKVDRQALAQMLDKGEL